MGFLDMCPRPARSSGVRDLQSVPSPPGHYPTLEEQQELGLRLRLRLREGLWSRRGEPLCSVDAPTPLLLRSPPLAKVQSHSHHLLRQVLSPYLAVPPRLEELVVIAVLHHSLLNCVVYDPCRPILRLSVGKVELGVILGSRHRRPR